VTVGRQKVKLADAFASGFVEVRMFSTWLASADFSKSKIKLSLLATSAPDDVWLTRVEPVLTVMASKQKPKRLTLVGSDDKRYQVLVKGGEDVRIDQRIQQLFEIMKAPGAFGSLRTFKVVPVSLQLGLIEWLSDTVTVRMAVSEGLGSEAHETPETKQRQAWVSSIGNDISVTYSKLISPSFSEDDVSSRFAVHSTPRLARSLRDFLRCRATSTEAFMAARVNFLRSLGSFNAAAYILGIGDRHLDNFLVCTKTGTVIGIDFGYSFGAGLLLPVPELMPVRLTRAFVGVGQPMSGPDAAGYYRESFESGLDSARKSRTNIISACDLFMREPLTDWSPDVGTVEARIANVKDKLAGVHPGLVMLKELSANKAQWVKQLLVNKRSWLIELLQCPCGQDLLDVSSQANAITALSISSNILGRVWQGWSPHI